MELPQQVRSQVQLGNEGKGQKGTEGKARHYANQETGVYTNRIEGRVGGALRDIRLRDCPGETKWENEQGQL
jgi:hypothetical protein